MPTCSALKANGQICGKNGNSFQGNCGIHHRSKLARDPTYSAEYTAYLANARQRHEDELAAVEQRRAERENARLARRAAEQALEERRRADLRAAQLAKNLRAIADAPQYSPALIISTIRKIVHLWNENNIPGQDIIHAYIYLKYVSSMHVGFPRLIRAAVSLVCLGLGNPDYPTYRGVPELERRLVLEDIHESLGAYALIDPNRLVAANDSIHAVIAERRQREETAERRRLAEEAVQAAQAALAAQAAQQAAAQAEAQRQLAIDLRERPVIFQRDPEGSINLAAFATDAQSVHRSSVQNATHKMILAILERPLLDGQDTLFELTSEFLNKESIHWPETIRDQTITEVTNDYYNTEAFSLAYGDVLDHVWAYIRPHEHQNELLVRLAQELAEGIGMCSNGKMARLMNVLQGYDETLEHEAPKELFHNKIALLLNSPLTSREAAARALFTEFNIQPEEQIHWLEPLLTE